MYVNHHLSCIHGILKSPVEFFYFLPLFIGWGSYYWYSNAAKLYEELTSMKNQDDTIQGDDNNEVVNNKNSD